MRCNLRANVLIVESRISYHVLVGRLYICTGQLIKPGPVAQHVDVDPKVKVIYVDVQLYIQVHQQTANLIRRSYANTRMSHNQIIDVRHMQRFSNR